MCVHEQWHNIYPDNTYELQERSYPCTHRRTPGHSIEVRTLQNVYVSPPSPVRAEIEVIAPSTYEGDSHAGSQTKRLKRRGKDGLRLEFDWHIPFTSRKKEPKKVVTVLRPAPRSTSGPVTPPTQPEPVTFHQPFARSPRQDMRPEQHATRWSLPPRVVEISPREVDPPRTPEHYEYHEQPEQQQYQQQQQHQHQQSWPPPPPPPPLQRPQTEPPLAPIQASRVHRRRPSAQAQIPASSPRPQGSTTATREHSRRATAGSSAQPPSPPRRNHSERRARQVDERIRELEHQLQEERRTARLERIRWLTREIEIERRRRISEVESECRHQEQEESRRYFKQQREERLRRDRTRHVEVHQNREDSIEDRGTRVIEQAVRSRHQREDEAAAEGGFIRRATVGLMFRPFTFRRRANRAGEEVIWEDDRRRTRRRWI